VYKIFISHTWRASNTYYRGLIRLLDEANKSDTVGLSVPNIHQLDSDKFRWRGRLLKALKAADALLVVVTPADITNVLIQSELRLAEQHEIPIVTIDPPKRHSASKTLESAAIAHAYSAQWTSQNIVDAIKTAVCEKPRASKAHALGHYAYQPVAAAAAGQPLISLELEAVRGDDEARISETCSAAEAKGQLPRDVLFRPRENSIARALALLPLPGRASSFSWGREVRN